MVLLLCSIKILFLMCGIALVAVGGLLLADIPRVLLSRLLLPAQGPTHPLFYYVALGFMAAGLAVCTTGVLGCWASCLQSHCILGLYLFLLIVLLLGECSLGGLITICPQYMGVGVSTARLVETVRQNYGVPGREQITAALDLAQTALECCGVSGPLDYNQSWWRNSNLGRRELLVPLSCCLLSNTNDTRAFLDPHPRNSSLCQAQESAVHQSWRHNEGCEEKLEIWFEGHTSLFLAISLGLVLVELSVLLSAILVCTKLPGYGDYES
ncbi:CD151 antigen-like, partial [Anabrus simplex]|uniref:CD151 antigen-like n=1 Tax=Anabrus simplex TaxID=316456 RepID=UPI0035A39312